jgi:hypothetical protein
MGFYIHGHCCCCWIRGQMKPPPLPFNLCADERISPGLSTNKSEGDPKKS